MPAKKKVTSKKETVKKESTKTVRAPRKTTNKKVLIPEVEEMEVTEIAFTDGASHGLFGTQSTGFFILNKKKTIRLIIILFVIGIVLYFLRSLFIVAIVNWQPVWRYSFDQQLEQQGGKQVLSNIESQMLIQQEANKEHISVSSQELAAAQKQIETDLSSQGQTLSGALAAQGMTMSQFQDQLKTQTLIEKLLAKDLVVTPQDIDTFISQNKDFMPQGISAAQASQSAKEQIIQQRVQNELPTYLANLQKKAKIVTFVNF